jgi:hypothetical protein
MPKKPPEINQNRNPVLTKSRAEVSGVLQARIKLGNEILLGSASRFRKEDWK